MELNAKLTKQEDMDFSKKYDHYDRNMGQVLYQYYDHY